MTKFKTLGMVLLIVNAMQIFAAEEEMLQSEAHITAIKRSFGVMQCVIDYLQDRPEIAGGDITATYQATNNTEEELVKQMSSMQEKFQTLRSRIAGLIDVNEIAAINDAVALGMAAPFRAEISADETIPEIVKTNDLFFLAYLNGMHKEQLKEKLFATPYAKDHELEVLNLEMMFSIRTVVKHPIN